MTRGKQTCKILKEIRRQIAEANDIELVTSECRYKGDCLGTCPKCEDEVRYLERQLRARTLSGRAVTLAGISAGALAMLMPMASAAQMSHASSELAKECVAVSPDTIMLHGRVVYRDTMPDGAVSIEPFIGATIKNRRDKDYWTATDIDGCFSMPVRVGDPLLVCFVGFYSKTIVVTEDMRDVTVELESDGRYEDIPCGMVLYSMHDDGSYLDLNVFDDNGNRLGYFKVERIWTDEYGELSESLFSSMYEDKPQFRIDWNRDLTEKRMPLKEAILRITAEGYDAPAIIKVKRPKHHAVKTVRFRKRKQ